MATDFISTYVPAFVELAPEEVADCRERLAAYFRTMFADIDTAPNTVIGDLVVTPQAFQIAALERGIDRLLSDLNLGNVAKNNIYNCAFVNEYLKNFAVADSYALRSSGVVRLVFSKDEEYSLDRGTQFKINDAIFSIYLPYNGKYYIKPVGTALEAEQNGTVLVDSGSDSYFADIPVVSDIETDVDIVAGTEVRLSVVLNNLGAANTLVDFNKGTSTNSTAELAERARHTIYSASLNTRNGAIRYIETNCPFVESTYAIRNGDMEMLRGFDKLGVSEGCMDVYVRSKSYAFEEEQVVRLTYDPAKGVFEGKFNYTGQPYYIDSITQSQDISGTTYTNIEHTITAVNTAGLGARGAYTEYEDLYITIPDQKINGTSIFNIQTAPTGEQYSLFTVNYHTDPLLRDIAATLYNPDYAPVNVSLLARGFIPIIIKKFNVRYVRKSGVVPDLETAEKEIRSYMDGLGAPNAYADSEISRIMGEAGVKYMAGIDVYATVQWSLGDFITPVGYTTKEQGVVPTKKNTTITTSQGLRVKYPGSGNTEASSMYACSIRNTRYYMLDTAVSFTEVKEM